MLVKGATGIYVRVILQELLSNLIRNTCAEISILKLLPNLSETIAFGIHAIIADKLC